MKQRLVITIVVATLSGIVAFSTSARAESPSCTAQDVLCYEPAAETLTGKVTSVTEPPIAVPSWLEGQ